MAVDLRKLAQAVAGAFDASVYATPDGLQFGSKAIPHAILGAMWTAHPDVATLVRALDLLYGSAPPMLDLVWPHLMATPPPEGVSRPAGPLAEVLVLRTQVGLVPVPRARLDPSLSLADYWAAATANLADTMPLPHVGAAQGPTPFGFWVDTAGADYAWGFARRCGFAAVFLPSSLLGMVLPDPTVAAVQLLHEAARDLQTEGGSPLLDRPVILHRDRLRSAS